MQSHYEINISCLGVRVWGAKPSHLHWARVTLPQMKAQEAQAIEAVRLLAKKFPADEGWKLDLTYWHGSGERIEWAEA